MGRGDVMLSPNEDIVLWGCTNASQWTEHSADNDDHDDDYGDNNDYGDNEDDNDDYENNEDDNDDFEDNEDYEDNDDYDDDDCEDDDDDYVDDAKVTGTDEKIIEFTNSGGVLTMAKLYAKRE